MNSRLVLLVASGITVCLLGCSSANVNPSLPKAHTGYVDFYTDSDLDLSWQIKRAADDRMRPVFSEFNPIFGNILRLATPAGNHRFEVWFINCFTTGPQTIEVQVNETCVTPVHVTLTGAGSTSAQSTSYEYRPTARATRRVQRTTTSEKETFQIGLTAADPQPYQPKERMPYFSSEPK